MGIDDDFPMTKTQVEALVVGLLVMGGIGAALFGGFIPGLKPNYAAASIWTVDGKKYNTEIVYLNLPVPLVNATSPQRFAFHDVNFTMWVTNWWSLPGGLVHGNGTETNGTVYPFVLGISNYPPVNTTLFIAPDHLWGAYWPGGFFAGPIVHLLVLA